MKFEKNTDLISVDTQWFIIRLNSLIPEILIVWYAFEESSLIRYHIRLTKT